MHLPLRSVRNPPLSLLHRMQDWRHIAAKLHKSPRKRRFNPRRWSHQYL